MAVTPSNSAAAATVGSMEGRRFELSFFDSGLFNSGMFNPDFFTAGAFIPCLRNALEPDGIRRCEHPIGVGGCQDEGICNPRTREMQGLGGQDRGLAAC